MNFTSGQSNPSENMSTLTRMTPPLTAPEGASKQQRVTLL